jgi:hypothetical protein
VPNESSFGSLNNLSIEDALASLEPSNLADLSAVNCVPVSTSGTTIQLLDCVESPWVRIRRLHVLWPIIRSCMDHCFLLSTTLATPGGLVLAPSASWITINWSKAIPRLIAWVLYHPKVSMESIRLICDCCSEETCLVVWGVVATRHKSTAGINVDVLILLLLLRRQAVKAAINWFERLSW